VEEDHVEGVFLSTSIKDCRSLLVNLKNEHLALPRDPYVKAKI